MYNNLTQQTPQQYYYGSYYPQQQIRQEAPAQNYIKGRPVVSIDEAKASPIDLDGSLYVFPDLGHQKIYTKQINLDGTASFNVYEFAAPVEPAATPSYVTRDEFEAALTQLKESLTAAPVKQSPQPATKFNL